MSNTLHDLSRSIDSARQLHGVIRTMKTMSAVSIHQYEDAAAALVHHTRNVEMGFRALLSSHPEMRAATRKARIRRVGWIVFGSEQGLCGAFNERIGEHFLQERTRRLAELGVASSDGAQASDASAPGASETVREPVRAPALTDAAVRALPRPDVAPPTPVAAIGHRVSGFIEDHVPGLRVGDDSDATLSTLRPPAGVSGIGALVRELLTLIEHWQQHHRIDQVLVSHNVMVSKASSEPRTQVLLPLDRAWLDALTETPWPGRTLPMLMGEPVTLLTRLVREHLLTTLSRVAAESLTAEHAARLASMQVAQKNLEQRIDELVRTHRRLRQSTVTEEIFDVIAGYDVGE